MLPARTSPPCSRSTSSSTSGRSVSASTRLRIGPGQELRDLEPVPHPRIEPEHAAHELPRRDIGDLRQRGDEALQRERRPRRWHPVHDHG